MSAVAISKIKARLLATPSLIDVRQAAVRIIATRHRCSEVQAEMRLGEFKDSVEIDGVFKRVLPDVYKRERGAIFERRRNFFKAIDERFPVDWEYLDQTYMEMEYDGVSFFYYGIMICSMRPFHDWAYREEWPEQPLAYRLSEAVFRPDSRAEGEHDAHWTQLARIYKLPDSLRPKGKADDAQLFKCFEGQRSPLKYLPLAAKVLSYNTGCVFFDFDEGDGMDALEWSRENVEWLTAQAKVGREINASVMRLDTWLRADPAKRIEQALGFYHKSRRLTDETGKRKNRIRVGAAAAVGEGRALVGIL